MKQAKSTDDRWEDIVSASLDWDQAHATLEAAVDGLPPHLRGRRPEKMPHSPWEILEHIRIAQRDLLDFCRDANYEHTLKWPEGYWPTSPAPPNEDAWDASLTAIRADRKALQDFTTGPTDLATRIPHGTGQTYLRTVLVALDHSAYHLGELVTVRRLLGAWPAAQSKREEGPSPMQRDIHDLIAQPLAVLTLEISELLSRTNDPGLQSDIRGLLRTLDDAVQGSRLVGKRDRGGATFSDTDT